MKKLQKARKNVLKYLWNVANVIENLKLEVALNLKLERLSGNIR